MTSCLGGRKRESTCRPICWFVRRLISHIGEPLLKCLSCGNCQEWGKALNFTSEQVLMSAAGLRTGPVMGSSPRLLLTLVLFLSSATNLLGEMTFFFFYLNFQFYLFIWNLSSKLHLSRRPLGVPRDIGTSFFLKKKEKEKQRTKERNIPN